MLYALFSNKQDVLLQATKDSRLNRDYSVVLQRYTISEMTMVLEAQSDELSEDYLKVWRSYLTYKNRSQADNHTKELIRQKVKRLQEKKRVTNYRIYTDLRLNPGNLNAWLKHGNGDKVSIETARRTLRYVETAVKVMPRLN